MRYLWVLPISEVNQLHLLCKEPVMHAFLRHWPFTDGPAHISRRCAAAGTQRFQFCMNASATGALKMVLPFPAVPGIRDLHAVSVADPVGSVSLWSYLESDSVVWDRIRGCKKFTHFKLFVVLKSIMNTKKYMYSMLTFPPLIQI
jgi:hypothetical protein